ncbi:MAG TPA: efflux RND transporter periplasmic adaptor subunit [Thermoanaerobaculia bacterium]|nr:efflux RND transporter periplasmic adaptor subunit [Thermoanaerobaculia bacterium]
MRRQLLLLWLVGLAVAAAGCGGGEAEGRGARDAGGRPNGGPGGFPGFGDRQAAVPVEVAVVARRDIADNLETTGTLEAEQEVDIVARSSGPIVRLETEEDRFVRAGELLARIDPRELQAQLSVSRVGLEEARANFERARASFESGIVSQEAYDQTRARFLSAEAQIESLELQLSYTEIRAPFDGLIIERAVKFAEFVSNGARLFRISDFDPLLCNVQIPEKDLGRLELGQRATLRVGAYRERRFEARVLRINPVVDSATGTLKVTLAVAGEGVLRPGMFASLYLQTAVHENALVVPKRALVLESIGDTVYVVDGDRAARREVRLGYQEADDVEVLAGLAEGERVVVVGQDELSDGTPVQVLTDAVVGIPAATPPASAGAAGARDGAPAPAPQVEGGTPSGPGRFGPGPGGMREIDWNDEAQVERLRSMMRQRGLSDEQVEERLQRMRQGVPAGRPPGGPPAAASGA